MIKYVKSAVKMLFIIGTLIAGFSGSVYGASFDMVLQWDENTEPDLATGDNPRYKIYYKTGTSGMGNKNNYIGLPDAEPAVADEGATPVSITVAMDEDADPDVVQFTLHDLEDTLDYYIAVSALDNFGNESDLSEEVYFEGGSLSPVNNAPVVVDLSVNNAQNSELCYVNEASGTVSVHIAATDTDGSVLQYLIQADDSDPSNGTFNDIAGTGASIDFTTTFTLGNDGSHTLYAWVKDDDGEISPVVSKSNILLDRGVPVAPGQPDLASGDDTGASDGDNITSRTSWLTLSGAGETGAFVQLFDNGAAVGNPVAVVAQTYSKNISLSPGSHTITARQTDPAGNVSAASTGLTLVVDPIAPSGTVSFNTVDTLHVNTGSLVVTATYDEPLAQAPIIDISGSGALDMASSQAMAGSGTIWTTSVTVPANDAAMYTASISNALDMAGNAAATVSGTFTTDTTDTDGDGQRDYEDTDDDDDGMPDTWENQYGMNPLVDDSDLDADGDGIRNIDEFTLELDPTTDNGNLAPSTPVLLLPENDTIVSAAQPVVLEIDGFADFNQDDVHAETEWQVYVTTDSGSEAIYEIRNTTDLTRVEVPVSVLAPETRYDWQVRVFDNHGAASQWSDTGYFNTDIAPVNEIPAVSLLNVNDETGHVAVYTNDMTGAVNVRIAASDTDGTVDQYLIQANNDNPAGGAFVSVPVTPAADVDFTVPFVLPADGDYTIYAWVLDNQGKMSQVLFKTNVHLDCQIPAAPGLGNLPANMDTGISNTDNITSISMGLTLSGTGENSAVVQLHDNNQPLGSPVTVSDGRFDVTFNLSEGRHELSVCQTDLCGNVSPISTPVTVIVDQTAPTGSVSFSAQNTDHVAAGALVITAAFDEILAQSPSIEISGGGTLDISAGEEMAGEGNRWTKSLTIPSGENVAYAVTVSGIADMAGNNGTAVAASFVTDSVDTDNDGVRDFEDADDDDDGMPDVWEIEFSLDPKVDDADLDMDNDGISNLDEYRYELNPQHADSDLAPVMPELLAPEDDAVVVLKPELVISDFEDINSEDTHAETEWQIYLDVDGEGPCVYELASQTALTRLVVPSLVLEPDTGYAWRARVYDNNGMASEWSNYGYFTTGSDLADLDNDGIADDQAVDSGVDLDDDGIPDAHQVDMKSVRVKGKGTLIGLGAQEAPNVIQINDVRSSDPSDAEQYPEMTALPGNMPYGLLDFKIEVDNPGDTVELTIFFSEKISADAVWYKYDSILSEWVDFSANTVISPNLKSITLTLTDGGLGDTDGLANGIIIDPSGLVASAEDPVEPAPVVSASGGGGGGCFIDTAGINYQSGLDKLFFGLFITFFLLFLVINRKQRNR